MCRSDATVADALAAARPIAERDDVPWESCDARNFRSDCAPYGRAADGDRIEIYRPLRDADPRESAASGERSASDPAPR